MFLFVHRYTKARCIEALNLAAVEADWQIGEIVDDSYIVLKNYGSILAEHCGLDVDETAGLFGHIHVGDMQMEERLYLPDGRIVTEYGLLKGLDAPESYDEILAGFDADGRYISCVRRDYIHEDRDVMEIYCPVYVGGKPAAIRRERVFPPCSIW